jgi:hypothetical protein
LTSLGIRLVDADIELGAVFGRAGDDQRGTGLVDQHRVHLVHQGVVERTLHPLLGREGHVVAQVVEAEFVVGAVGDVAGVGVALLVAHARQVAADGQAEELEQRAVGLGVTAGQIVVHRHHVHATAGQGVQVSRQGCGQGLALTGFHFRDAVGVQHHAADQLHVEVAHAEHPLGGLAHGGEGFRQQLLQGLTLLHTG